MSAKYTVVTAITLGLLWVVRAFAADPVGQWLTQDGEAKVQIFSCGSAYCGKIVWLKNPNDPDTQKPKLDKFNQDASKHARPVAGMQIISSMKPGGKSDVWEGSLYNPKDGRTYNGSLTMLDAGSLKLQGCALGIFCKSEVWHRTN